MAVHPRVRPCSGRGPATAAAAPFDSATARRTSTSSTATAGSSTPPTSTAAARARYGETWRTVASFADFVCQHWREPDAGIWEERGPATHHVHSKVIAWLAVDRATRIADRRGASRRTKRRRERWARERDAIAAEVRARGFDAARQTYTRTYGSTDTDAALLLLPLVGLEPPDSPRLASTIDAIRAELHAGGPLHYRYPPGRDVLPGGEGAFLPCSYWAAQALAATGRADEAGALVEELLALASPLGLLSEEVDPTTGELLGNFPQALSHAALIQAALAIRQATAGPGAQ